MLTATKPNVTNNNSSFIKLPDLSTKEIIYNFSKAFDNHTCQKEIHKSKARYKVIVAGRRFGKTFFARMTLLDYCVHNDNKRCRWVSPRHILSKEAFEEAKKDLKRHKIHYQCNNQEKIIYFNNGTKLDFLSTEKEETLVSVGLDYLIVDEAGKVKDKAYLESLRPSLLDKKGVAVIIGTPKGKSNWLYNVYQQGLSRDLDYESFSYRTIDNPTIDNVVEEVEKARKELPESVYQQEFEAVFIDSGGSVFENVDAIFHSQIDTTPSTTKKYYIGIDVAKEHDYTVAIVMNNRREVINMVRIQGINYVEQAEIIKELYNTYRNPAVIVDTNGVGNAFADILESSGCRCERFKYTNQNKVDFVQKLRNDILNRQLSIPINYQVIKDELVAYEVDFTKGNKITYNAPTGLHDDCVIALALCNWITPNNLNEDMHERRSRSVFTVPLGVSNGF